MTVALWIVQTLRAIVFLAAAGRKVSRPKDALAKDLGGALPVPLVRFMGAAEILGAIGLIAPDATRIAPVLTPIAAVGLAVVMLSAIIFHVPRKEFSNVGGNVALLLLVAFIVVGRFALAPISG